MPMPSLDPGAYIVSSTNGSDFSLVVSGEDTTTFFTSHDSILSDDFGSVPNGLLLKQSSGSTSIVYDSGDEAYVVGATIAGASAPAKFWTGYVACEE